MNPLNLPEAITRLQKQLIGSDNYFNSPWLEAPNFPPYNVEKLSPESYRLTLALAGYSKDEITVNVQGSSLLISGVKKFNTSDKECRNFLHQGIAERDFRREFKLTQNTYVKDAEFKDGLLAINIQYEMPEALKPRQIDVT